MDREKIEYHDKWIIPSVVILLSFIFVGLGYLEHGGAYEISIESFAVNFLYTLLTVLLMRGLIHILDILYPWRKGMYQRFGLQIGITLIVYLLIQSFIIFNLKTQSLTGPDKLETIFAVYFVGVVSLVLINCLFLVLYIRHHQKEAEVDNQNFISGRVGSKRVSFLKADIRWITIDNTLVQAYDQYERKIVLQESLSDLEPILDPSSFFRANRQYILNRAAIKEVIYNDNKSCTIELLHGKHEIVVSRHRASSFKKWLNMK